LHSKRKIGLYDPDASYVILQRFFFERRFPNARIKIHTDPERMAEEDVCILGLEEHQYKLIVTIRQTRPNALLILWSQEISPAMQSLLSSFGVDLFVEKGKQQDIDMAVEKICEHLNMNAARPTLRETAASIRDLLSEWSGQLEMEESLRG